MEVRETTGSDGNSRSNSRETTGVATEVACVVRNS